MCSVFSGCLGAVLRAFPESISCCGNYMLLALSLSFRRRRINTKTQHRPSDEDRNGKAKNACRVPRGNFIQFSKRQHMKCIHFFSRHFAYPASQPTQRRENTTFSVSCPFVRSHLHPLVDIFQFYSNKTSAWSHLTGGKKVSFLVCEIE